MEVVTGFPQTGMRECATGFPQARMRHWTPSTEPQTGIIHWIPLIQQAAGLGKVTSEGDLTETWLAMRVCRLLCTYRFQEICWNLSWVPTGWPGTWARFQEMGWKLGQVPENVRACEKWAGTQTRYEDMGCNLSQVQRNGLEARSGSCSNYACVSSAMDPRLVCIVATWSPDSRLHTEPRAIAV